MINVAGIIGGSIVDGPGIRTVIFCQGCPHHCQGCHNPETWEFTEKTMMSTDDLVDIIRSNPLCHGVTFSGGEPFAQAEGFAELAKVLKTMGYEVASYTGYTFEQLMDGTPEQMCLLSTLDVIIDGSYRQKERDLSLQFRGSSNQRILDVKSSLMSKTAVWTTDERWIGYQ